MLVLTRKVGEKFMLGEDVVITVLGRSRKKIRIGIDAPKSLDVYREEIFKRLQQEKDQGEL